MNITNLQEAYSAVYDEELRSEIYIPENDDLSFIDDLSDNELVQVMEEIFTEGEFTITECVELLNSEFLSEGRVDMAARAARRKADIEYAEKQAREASSRQATAKREKSAERERVGRKHAVKRLQVAATRAARNLKSGIKTKSAGAASAAMGGAAEVGRKLSSAKNKVKGFLGKVKRAAQSGYSAAKKEFSGQAGKEAKARTTGRQMRRAARNRARVERGRDTSEFEKPKSSSNTYRNVGAGTRERAGGSTEKETSTSYDLSSVRRKKAQEKLKRAASGNRGGVRFSAGPAGQSSNTAMRSGAGAEKERQKMAKKFATRAGISDSYEFLVSMIAEELFENGYVDTISKAYDFIVEMDDFELNEIVESLECYLPEEYSEYEEDKETLDVYDVVLEHLLDKGYADSVEGAEAIMVNMSEEWKNEILDEAQIEIVCDDY